MTRWKRPRATLATNASSGSGRGRSRSASSSTSAASRSGQGRGCSALAAEHAGEQPDDAHGAGQQRREDGRPHDHVVLAQLKPPGMRPMPRRWKTKPTSRRRARRARAPAARVRAIRSLTSAPSAASDGRRCQPHGRPHQPVGEGAAQVLGVRLPAAHDRGEGGDERHAALEAPVPDVAPSQCQLGHQLTARRRASVRSQRTDALTGISGARRGVVLVPFGGHTAWRRRRPLRGADCVAPHRRCRRSRAR